jgi:hypothetical protein
MCLIYLLVFSSNNIQTIFHGISEAANPFIQVIKVGKEVLVFKTATHTSTCIQLYSYYLKKCVKFKKNHPNTLKY